MSCNTFHITILVEFLNHYHIINFLKEIRIYMEKYRLLYFVFFTLLVTQLSNKPKSNVLYFFTSKKTTLNNLDPSKVTPSILRSVWNILNSA